MPTQKISWRQRNKEGNAVNVTASKPEFAQSIDADRPHSLLTKNVQFSGSLLYRYDDTQETVTVPNIWYNQTYQVRAESIRWDAKVQDDKAASFAKNPQPCNLSPAAVADIVGRFRARAERIRAEANKMEAAGELNRPVAASNMKIDYGQNVFS